MESPRQEINDAAPYRILKRCPSCHITYRTTPGVQPCPSCGDLEDTSGPLRARMSSGQAGATRVVRNWPLTFAALIFILSGPACWLEASLQLALHSFATYLRRYPVVPRLALHLPLSPAFLAVTGTVLFAIGILILSISRHKVVVKPPRRKRGEEEEPEVPLELGRPEWLAEATATQEVTYVATPKPPPTNPVFPS